MSRPSCVCNAPQRNRNNVIDLLRAMPVRVYVKDAKSPASVVWIVYGTNGLWLDFVEQKEIGFMSTNEDVRAVP